MPNLNHVGYSWKPQQATLCCDVPIRHDSVRPKTKFRLLLQLPRLIVGISDILNNVVGWHKGDERICVLNGELDMLARGMYVRMVAEYRDGVKTLKRAKKVEAKPEHLNVPEEEIEGVSVEGTVGVRQIMVKNAGHHVQNDVQREKAAEALRRWIEQL